MQHRRLDDYQGWQVRLGGACLLVDPWLTPEPITGSFDRQHPAGFVTAQQLADEADALVGVLLCTHVSDHARPVTLALLREVPVLGPHRAMRVARRAGCQRTHAMRPGASLSMACPDGSTLQVTVTRTGLPLGLIAVGYLIEGRDPHGSLVGRIWIEPHQPTVRVARQVATVDVALLPCTSVRAVVVPVTAGPAAGARAAAAAGAAVLVPTATEPERDMTRWQRALYAVRGGVPQARSLLAAPTLVERAAGASLDLSSIRRGAAPTGGAAGE